MAIREFECPKHGKFEKQMSIMELPDTLPCPRAELDDTDSMTVEIDDEIVVAQCGRDSKRLMSVPGLIIL
jgi:hypothetical protein